MPSTTKRGARRCSMSGANGSRRSPPGQPTAAAGSGLADADRGMAEQALELADERAAGQGPGAAGGAGLEAALRVDVAEEADDGEVGQGGLGLHRGDGLGGGQRAVEVDQHQAGALTARFDE